MWHRVAMSVGEKLQYRRYLCSIFGLSLLLPLVVDGPSNAGDSFPKIHLENTIVTDVPLAIARFREQAQSYSREGAFALDGSTQAKAWFLSHVSSGFVCERDFGGSCSSDAYIDRINSFLIKSGDGSLYGDGAAPANPESLLSRGLHTVSIDLSAMSGPLARHEEAPEEYCRAGLVPQSWELLHQATARVLADPKTGISDELMSTDRLKGVLGVWNVRAAPDISSDIVGQVHNEVVLFLPQEGSDDQAGPADRVWHAVLLHSGIRGYLAAKDTDLLHQIHPRLCLGLNADGRAVITRYIGGGD